MALRPTRIGGATMPRHGRARRPQPFCKTVEKQNQEPHHKQKWRNRQLHRQELVMATKADDIKLHINQTAAMNSILLSMTRGYVWHCSGEIKTEKAHLLVEKFNDRYGVLKAKLSLERRATRGSRQAARNGQPHHRHSASFVIHPMLGGDKMRWVLLGTGPLEGEEMKNGLLPNQRLVWGKYQLYQKPKDDGRSVGWTWRLTRQENNLVEGGLINVARSNRQNEFKDYLRIARNYPMFAGVRVQIIKACERALSVWNRQHPTMPMEPIQRLPVMSKMPGYANPPETLGMYQSAYQQRLREAMGKFMSDEADAPFFVENRNQQSELFTE